jgi:protein ImuB
MGRILCAWSPTWAIANWRRRNPTAASPDLGAPQGPPPPFALLETVSGMRRLAAISLEAARCGLYPQQRATDALALVPHLLTAEAEPEADAAALTALVDWCVRFSPAVAADAPDGLFLDIAGAAHLWGGEAEMLADIQARLAANGLPFRAAVADTPGAAWALAHHGQDGTIAAPGDQARWLAPLPPAALRLEAEPAAQIERLGFRNVGQLMDLPRAPLGRRFGRGTLERLDQALGRSREALHFRRPATPWFARLAFFEPISAPEDMARVAVDICAKLCARLEAEGQGARQFELCYHRLDGRVLPVSVGLSLAGRDALRLGKLFAPKVESVDPGFGIEVVTLAAFEVEPISGRQGRLDAARTPTVEEGLAPLVDRLANRLGEDRVWRAVAVQSHVPEQAVGRARPLAAPAPGGRAWDPEAPRPVRLFRRPEPLDQVLALTPDEPPRRFDWRGRTHVVRHAEGPERIGEEWWRRDITDIGSDHIRDYYRVEDAEGGRFWLFRVGFYGDPEAPPKWWLHGLFG